MNAIHPAAIQYICRTNGLSDQWTVGPMDCRTNGLYGSLKFVTVAIHLAAIQTVYLSDQWTVDQWTVGPMDCMAL